MAADPPPSDQKMRPAAANCLPLWEAGRKRDVLARPFRHGLPLVKIATHRGMLSGRRQPEPAQCAFGLAELRPGRGETAGNVIIHVDGPGASCEPFERDPRYPSYRG